MRFYGSAAGEYIKDELLPEIESTFRDDCPGNMTFKPLATDSCASAEVYESGCVFASCDVTDKKRTACFLIVRLDTSAAVFVLSKRQAGVNARNMILTPSRKPCCFSSDAHIQEGEIT